MDRQNFYLLLGLDCSEKDPAKIDAAIRTKQAEWSRDRIHPTRGRQAQLNLELLKDIRVVMADSTKRDAEAIECARLRKEREKESARELDEVIAILSASGSVSEKEVDELARRFKGRFTEAEVRRRIKVPVTKENGPGRPCKPTLDKSQANEVTNRLRLVAKKDLYDFLDRRRTSSLAALQTRTRELDADVRKSNNKTAEVTARQELVGYCLQLFKDEKERDKYNNTLDQQGLQELDPLIEAAGSQGEIRAEVMEQLLRKAREKGVEAEDARRYILKFASGRKWSVQVPPSDGGAKLQRCGNCGILNAEKALACRECGEPLTVECPRCKTVNPSENRACLKCGFTVGDAALVRRLLRDADLAVARGETRDALRLLHEAEIYWPESADIQSRRAAFEKRLEEEKQLHQQILNALTQRRFLEARRLLASFKRTAANHPDTVKLGQQIDVALKVANQNLQQAAALERAGRVDDAMGSYSEALRECQDLQAARDGLAKCPPSAPHELEVVSTSQAIVLNWQPSPSRGQVQYRVLRKPLSEPRAHADGDLVGMVAATSLTDSAALPGELYYYAVYTDRAGAVSIRAAVKGPVLRTAEVEALQEAAGDCCVSLKWKPPPRARQIEIWRKVGHPPRCRGEGTRLTGVTLHSASDTKLSNGVCYGYRVVAVFEGAAGQPVYSDGLPVTVTPTELPPPVTDLTVVCCDGNFEVTWSPPAAGQVQVYACALRPPHPCGTVVGVSALGSLGRALTALGPRSARGQIGCDEVLHLLPVTVAGQTAVVGQVQTLTWLDDVEELRTTVEGGNLLARWKWPKDVESVVVAWRKEQFPTGPDDPGAAWARCVRFKYDQQGGFRTNVPPDVRRLFVAVYAMTNRAGEWHHASGTSAGARREVALQSCCRVKYRVTPNRVLGLIRTGGYKLEITPDDDTLLPELLLVIKAGGLPLHSKDGTVVLRIPAGSTCSPDRPLSRMFQLQSPPRSWKARLFPADEAQGQGLDFFGAT
jgi:hypothetical protein